MQSDNGKGYRVLVVDDEHDTITVISQGLTRNGFRVSAYSDPLFALAEFKESYYDIILLDVRMPNLTGFELAKRIWQKDANAKIAFMSAYEIYEKDAAVNFGGLRTVHFISKPVTAAALTEILRQNIEASLQN